MLVKGLTVSRSLAADPCWQTPETCLLRPLARLRALVDVLVVARRESGHFRTVLGSAAVRVSANSDLPEPLSAGSATWSVCLRVGSAISTLWDVGRRTCVVVLNFLGVRVVAVHWKYSHALRVR